MKGIGLFIGLSLSVAELSCSVPERSFVSIAIKRSRPFFERACSGSGVLIDKKQGLFLTNAHVVCQRPFASLYVSHAGGDFIETNVIASDPTSDLAILQCDPSKIKGMTEAPISQRSTVPGMWAKSISNESATKQGKVSIKEGVFADGWRFAKCLGGFISSDVVFIYTAGGCSGSPMFNEFNEIQGLTCGMSRYLAHVIPIHRVRSFVDNVRRHLRDPKQPINSHILQGYSVCAATVFDVKNVIKGHIALQKERKCLLVYRVFPKEGVERALRVGDVILSVNGKKMHGSERSFDEEVVRSSALDCEVLRDGSIVRVGVGVETYDPNAGEVYTYGPKVFRTVTKMYAAELPEETVLDYTHKHGRAVFVASGQCVTNLDDLVQVLVRRGWKPLCLGVGAENSPGKQVRLMDIDLSPAYRMARHYTYKGPCSQMQNIHLRGVA